MNRILQIILAVTTLIPQIIQIVMAIEQAVGAGNGALKKDMAMTLLEPVITSNAALSDPLAQQLISKTVDNAVLALNKGQVLKKN